LSLQYKKRRCSTLYWNSSAVRSWSSHRCHRVTKTILSLSSWPFCCIWYHRPWHSDYSPVFSVRNRWICLKLV